MKFQVYARHPLGWGLYLGHSSLHWDANYADPQPWRRTICFYGLRRHARIKLWRIRTLGDNQRRIRELEALIREHHSVGAMDGVYVGDDCPLCTRQERRQP